MKLIISLYPFAAIGGGELYTVCVWKAMALHDSDWKLLVPLCDSAASLRNDTAMLQYAVNEAGEVIVSSTVFGDVVMDWVPLASELWIHQFAASPLVYDLCAAARLQSSIWLTNLGCDPILEEFGQLCGHRPGMVALEISAYAARRTKDFRLDSAVLTGGIWKKEIGEMTSKIPNTLVSVGRVLPHKGFDVTIGSLPDGQNLTIIGNTKHHTAYRQHLLECAKTREVNFAVGLSNEQKNKVVASSQFLIASSTHLGYDGSVYPQAELLGLVLLEAVAQGTLPISSDIPPFLDIMQKLGLEDLVYPEGDRQALQRLLEKNLDLSGNAYRKKWLQARDGLFEHYLWDDFATRFDFLTGEFLSHMP